VRPGWSPPAWTRICAGLQFLGITLDGGRNEANAVVISAEGAPAEVRVIRTDEESMIARYVMALVGTDGP
jgi:acetate kinase